MASKKHIRKAAAAPAPAANQPKKQELVIQQITQLSVDRTMKTVADFISALQSAESIYYPNRTRLYDLYKHVDLDGHLTGLLQKRISSVLNKKWCFKANDKEVEAIETFIKTNQFRNVLKGIMNSIFWGVTGFEFQPGEKIVFKEIPRKHIKPEIKVITLNQSDQEGTPYEPISNIWVVGDDKDYGLLLKCCFYALTKKGNFGDWAQYVEIFGQPIRIAKYDAYDIKTKDQLANVLETAGSSLAIMIPKQAEFEIMDGKASNGDGQLQERLKNACNNEMSVIVLGNTETTSNDNGGSNAKAGEQGKQQDEITKDDTVFVRNILNDERFINILRSYGLPVDGGSFEVEIEPDVNVMLVNTQVDEALKRMNIPLADDYFYNAYNRPKPENYDELKNKMEEQQQAKLNPPMPVPGKPKPKPGSKEKLSDEEQQVYTWFERMRLKVADFFDLAHKD